MPSPALHRRPSLALNDARPGHGAIQHAVLRAVEASLRGSDLPVVLAISGGLDSMVLLDAAARVAGDRIATVATFDHGSGAHATEAATFVREEARRRGLQVEMAQASAVESSEAGWRAARWAFLKSVARASSARVATAHTADDQVETVCMRILRGSGARGLAGLYAGSAILRPLLGLRRAALAEYAAATGVHHVEDPTNASMAFLRNRLRRDLLPAIAHVRPGFAMEITELALRASEVRRALDDIARTIVAPGPGGSIEIPLARVVAIDAEHMGVLVPALAACGGIILDRRGTTRLSQFILRSRTGARMQLSGAVEAVRLHDRVAIRPAVAAAVEEQRLADITLAGCWQFRRAERVDQDDPWSAALPAERMLTVRAWRAGDRMRATGSRTARRVKRFFSDAGIVGPLRDGWPVVLADGEIIWIPGVRRSDAATDRSGRPVLRYRCERNDV